MSFANEMAREAKRIGYKSYGDEIADLKKKIANRNKRIKKLNDEIRYLKNLQEATRKGIN